ncbi:MAG: hypothetical protein EOM32_02445 [Spirochaetia bacterium]|nr:hypothetical protein [Spirochaetia bacterium]NCC89576.1 hypothetical protein [Spirochaetia bacterium]
MSEEIRYANGQVEMMQSGNILTHYYKSGIVKSQGPLKENLMDGQWHFYRENGMVHQVGTYKKGVKDGPWVRYNKVGALEYEALFEEGKEVSKRLYH